MEKKEKTGDQMCRRFAEHVQVRKIDEDERTIEFVASDNSVDSHGTVLPVEGWDLSRYEKNGVVGYQHEVYGKYDGNDPDQIIGKGRAFVEDGQLIIAITFEPKEINEKAEKIYRKVQFGSLNAVSVGFVPTRPGHWGNEDRGEDPNVYYYNGQQLLEVSVVNIPSNANAVKRSFESEREALEAQREATAPAQQPVAEPKGKADAEEIREQNHILTNAFLA